MSKYALEIEFNDEGGSDDGVDKPVGSIVVHVSESCGCRNLDLHWRKRVDGESSGAGKPSHKETIVKWVSWVAGQTYEYPFVPDGPPEDAFNLEDRWLVRPEVQLLGHPEPETPLDWTPLPEKASGDPEPGLEQDLPVAEDDPEPAVSPPVAEVRSEGAQVLPPAESPSFLRRIFGGTASREKGRCRLSIELDRREPIYRPGEPISGKVRARVLEDCRYRELVIFRKWKTHGKGNQDAGGYGSMTLDRDIAWQQGVDYAYRFVFNAPRGPFSYNGHYINIAWYLRAKAYGVERSLRDVDPTSRETEFLLPPEAGDVRVAPLSKVSDFEPRLLLVVFIPLLFFLAWAVLAYLEVADFKHYFWWSIVPLGIGMLFALAGARNFITQLSLGRIVLEVDSPRGVGVLEALVRVTPRRSVQVSAVEMQLVVTEKATEGSGSNVKTHTKKVFRKSTAQPVGYALATGRTAEFHLHLDLPDYLPGTMDRNSNKITWTATFKVMTGSWRQWSKSYQLEANYRIT